MKKLLIPVVLIALFAFSYATKPPYKVSKLTAEVIQTEGLYVYIDSKPVLPYELIGTVNMGLRSTPGPYLEMKDQIIKTVKDRYMVAEGVIIKEDKTYVIRFIENGKTAQENKEE